MCHLGLSRVHRDIRSCREAVVLNEEIEEIEDVEPAMFGFDSWCWMIS